MTAYSWASASSGSWTLAAKWTPSGGPPTSSDTVTISATGSAYAVQLGTAGAAAALTLSSANADLAVYGASGALAIGGAFTMSAGRVDIGLPNSGYNSGKISVGGGLALSGGTFNVNNGATLALAGTLSQTGGVLNFGNGGTIAGGTIKSTAGTINLSGGTLSGTTYDGPLNLTALNTTLHLANGAEVVGSSGSGPGTINVGGLYSYLYFDGTQTISNTTINLGYNSAYGDNLYQFDPTGVGDETLTLAATTTVNFDYYDASIYAYDNIVNAGIINDNASNSYSESIAGANFTNQGTINAKAADDSLSISATTFTNSGLIDIANGAAVTINDTTFDTTSSSVITLEANSTLSITPTNAWANLGSITVGAGAIFNLGGAFSASSLGNLSNSGGTLNVEGDYDNTSQTLDGTASFGQLTLYGGTISGGVATSAGVAFSSAGGTLSGVTYDGPLNLATNGSIVHLANGAQVVGSSGSGPGTINVGGNSSYLYFDGTQTVSNTTINLGNGSTYGDNLYQYDPSSTDDETLTLAATTTVNFDYYSATIYAYDSIVNAGVINDNASNSYNDSITGANFTNQGTINVKAIDDSLNISATTFTNSGLIDIANGATVTINGATFATTSSSEITPEANSTLYITPANNWANLGSITVGAGANLYLGGATSAASLGNLSNSGGAVKIDGAYDNTGQTLDGTASFGQLTLSGGTISGGAATAAGVAFSSAGGTLSGVTYDGPLNLATSGSILHLANGAQVVGSSGSGPGTINIGGSSTLYFDGTQTVSNTTINLGDDSTYGDTVYQYDSTGAGDETLVLAATTTVNFDYGDSIDAYDKIVNAGTINDNATASPSESIAGQAFTNQGTINVKSAAGVLFISPTTFTNSGLIDIANGGAANVTPTTFTNLASRTLTGGTYQVEAGSTLDVYVTSATSIATLSADVILSGSGSAFTQYQTNIGNYLTLDASLRTISATGELQLLAGRNWTTANAAITNNGIINLGGGAITATTASASLTDAAGSHLVGFGTVNATTFSNSGTIEAKGGALTLHLSVAGAGVSQIDAGADLIVAAGLGGAVNFAGDDATLQINTLASFTGSLGGFSLGDTIFLPGVTATGASVNGADQLIVVNGATTVATLQLNAAYANFAFVAVGVSGGTNIVALPIPATVSQYLAMSADYDLIPGGFTISDSAGNIAASLGSLSDSHINNIVATGGVVTVSVATAAADQAILDKIVGGYAISDTAQALSSALPTLTDSLITSLIVADNQAVQVNVAELTSAAIEIGKLVDASGGAASLAVLDTAANISADLDNLNGANIASITISDNNPITVSVNQLTSDAVAIGKLADANSALSVSLTVADSAANISAALDTLNGSAIGAIVIADNAPIGVSIAQIASDSVAIGKLIDANSSAATLAVTDTAADISADLDNLNGAGIASITISDNNPLAVDVAQLTSDAAALAKLFDANSSPYLLDVTDSSANIAAGISTLQADIGHLAAIATTGGLVAVNEATFALDQGALDKIVGGFEVSDTLPNLVSNLALLNADNHIDELAASGGVATISGGVPVAVATFVLSGAGAALTVAEMLSLDNLNLGAGASISVSATDTLTLTGASTLAGVVSGAGTLAMSGGSATISAAPTVASWTAAGTAITVSSALTYNGAFTFGAGSTLNLSGGALALKGAATLAGGATTGSQKLFLQSNATLSGALTIGGSSGLYNTGTLLESGLGALTLGDASGSATTVTNAAGAVWNILNNQGVAVGNAAGSTVYNQGTLEKTVAAGLSKIAAKLISTGSVSAATGIIDLTGANNLISGALTGAGEIEIGGVTSLNAGASASVAKLYLTGAGSTLQVLTNLTYAGALTEGSGAGVSIGAGDTLTLTGANNLSGAVFGAGTLAMSGGSATITSPAALTMADWTSDDTALSIIGVHRQRGLVSASNETLTLTGGALVFNAAATLTNVTLAGTQGLQVYSTTTVAGGLTLSAATSLTNGGAGTQSGALTIGDSANGAALFKNLGAGVWTLNDGASLAAGSTNASLVNNGRLQKTSGAGTASVSAALTNNAKLVVSSGTLDFSGAITAHGTAAVSGAATLEFDAAVAATQTIDFTGAGGALDLTDFGAFSGRIYGFDTAGLGSNDSIVVGGPWTYAGFSENAAHTLGALKFSDGGSLHSVTLLGNYNAASFVASVSGGSTHVTYS